MINFESGRVLGWQIEILENLPVALREGTGFPFRPSQEIHLRHTSLFIRRILVVPTVALHQAINMRHYEHS